MVRCLHTAGITGATGAGGSGVIGPSSPIFRQFSRSGCWPSVTAPSTAIAKATHDVDLVALLLLRDPPASRIFDRDRPLDRQPHSSIGIGDQIAALDDLIEVVAHRGQISGGLRVFDHGQAFGRQTAARPQAIW